MLEFGFEYDEALQSLESIPAVIDRQRPQMLVRAVNAIKQDAQADLVVKSRGGTGADGISWKAVTPAEARRKQRIGKPLIGIRSGRMLAPSNLQVQQRGEEVVLDFVDIEKAAIFDADRPLLPAMLPARWYRHATKEVQNATDAVVGGIDP